MAKSKQLRDKKIDIIKNITGRDEYGEPIDETQIIANNIWTYYRQASSDEFYAAATANYKVEAIFGIKHRKDIDHTCKVVFRGETYEISRIDDYEGYVDTLRIYASKIS